jgi:NAD(P)H dehydrogenase (quinone)
MVYVPLGYKTPELMQMNEVMAGSPWGSSTLAAGDGSRAVSALEHGIGEVHGKHFAEIVSTFVA